jgi:hypothetical protein
MSGSIRDRDNKELHLPPLRVHMFCCRGLAAHLVLVKSYVVQTTFAEAASALQLQSSRMIATHEEAERIFALLPALRFGHHGRALYVSRLHIHGGIIQLDRT